MRIVLASSEAVPYAKTGGLADVASALAKALAALGHQVWLILPHYTQTVARAVAGGLRLEATGLSFPVSVGPHTVDARLLWSQLPNSDVTVFLVDQPQYFNRPGLYNDAGRDYGDNCARFSFFSRAVVEICRRLVLRPDVIHANDWQTGLIPAIVQAEHKRTPGLEQTASVFTLHNMAFQGSFWHWDMLLTGLDWKLFNWKQMEAYGQLNLLKTGIVFADMLTTVSPTYAKEIQTPEAGCGLHGVLSAHRDQLVGILNGVDIDVWNPETDPAIARNYNVHSVADGKAVCKSQLQEQLGLPVRREAPLFGMISRMTDQKGLDLISQCSEELLQSDVQFAFLGTGDRHYEGMLEDLSRRFPQKVAARIGFDEMLAHRIEAGSDAYLMPSRYEPCGLNQMYSLIYGTVPIVRAVGGLADSVVDTNQSTLANRTATGLRFDDYDSRELSSRVNRAVELFGTRGTWSQIVQNGMRQDWSWSRSARQYLEVYRKAQDRRLNGPSPVEETETPSPV